MKAKPRTCSLFSELNAGFQGVGAGRARFLRDSKEKKKTFCAFQFLKGK